MVTISKKYVVACAMVCFGITHTQDADSMATMQKPLVHIILGSTRKGRNSEKIGQALKRFAATRNDIRTEIIDLQEYVLPFLQDDVPPMMRQVITDPAVKRWSDTIQKADAYIIVSPEYNAGYSAVLKNALDTLYKEWNGKKVAFVTYSGGPSGGASVAAQLRQVVLALGMVPVDQEIRIPQAWKAFDAKGGLVAGDAIATEFAAMLAMLVNK